jgi:hypothetical protein
LVFANPLKEGNMEKKTPTEIPNSTQETDSKLKNLAEQLLAENNVSLTGPIARAEISEAAASGNFSPDPNCPAGNKTSKPQILTGRD